MGIENHPNFATKKMSFTLALEHEAVIPTEIGVNTLRVSKYEAGNNDKRFRLNLDFINEIRYETPVRAMTRRQQVANYYNTKVKPRTLVIRDLILHNCHASLLPVEQGKLSPTWK